MLITMIAGIAIAQTNILIKSILLLIFNPLNTKKDIPSPKGYKDIPFKVGSRRATNDGLAY